MALACEGLRMADLSLLALLLEKLLTPVRADTRAGKAFLTMEDPRNRSRPNSGYTHWFAERFQVAKKLINKLRRHHATIADRLGTLIGF
jgi:hypothetical protein